MPDPIDRLMTERERKVIFNKLKKNLVKGWGKKHKDFDPCCSACQLHHALATVEWFLGDMLPIDKPHK